MSVENYSLILIGGDSTTISFFELLLRYSGDLEFRLFHLPDIDEFKHSGINENADVIIIDLAATDEQQIARLNGFVNEQKEKPVIILTDASRIDLAYGLMDNGAQDFIVRDTLSREVLIRSIKYSVKSKTLKNSLYESERKYRLLIELSPNAIVIHSPEKILFLNPAAKNLLDSSDGDDLVGRNIYDFIHPDFRELAMRRMKNLAQGEESKLIEVRFMKLNGELIDVEVVSAPLNYEGETAFQTIFRDITSRKLAERTLREKEYNLSSLINNTEDAIWAVDKNLCLIICNRKFENKLIAAANRKIQKGEPLLPGIWPVSRQREWRKYYDRAFGGESFSIEIFAVFDKGRQSEYRFNPIIADQNTIVGVTVFQRDISERKLMERQIRESEEDYRHLIEILPEGITIVNIEGKILYASERVYEMFGLSKEHSLFGDHFFNWLAEGQRDTAREKMKIIFGNPLNVINAEYLMKRKDKSEFWVEMRATCLMDAEGNPKAVMSIMRDITEKKHYEMHLLQSEEKFRTLFQSAGDAIYLADLEGNIFEANEFACKILNYRRADLIKKNLADVISPGDIKPVQEGLRTMEMTGELNTEIVFVTKDGSQIPFDVRAKLIEYEGRKAVIGIVRDISERKKENAELKKAKEAAEKADKLKSEFLAQVSHEIRSPLNIVLNFSRLLRSELPGKIKPELIESFDAIDNAGERIVRTIDLLLNMAELQSGSYEPEFRTLDIYADIMENIYSEYKFHAEYKGLQLFLDKRTEETMVLVDDFSTTQILANLVDNAIKYTRKGKIELSVEAGLHNDVIVKVSDTGIGISKEYLPKMFEPFSQEEQGYTRSFEGSGLGLALVKKYCEINNVGIRCQSKKGKGTTFSIAFPKVTNRTINKQGQLFPI